MRSLVALLLLDAFSYSHRLNKFKKSANNRPKREEEKSLGAIKAYGGAEVQTHVFLTSELHGGEWQNSQSSPR